MTMEREDEAIEAGVRALITLDGRDPDENDLSSGDLAAIKAEVIAVLAAAVPYLLPASSSDEAPTPAMTDARPIPPPAARAHLLGGLPVTGPTLYERWLSADRCKLPRGLVIRSRGADLWLAFRPGDDDTIGGHNAATFAEAIAYATGGQK